MMGLHFFQRATQLQQQYGQDGQAVGNALQTNGILLDSKWCQFLHEYNFLLGISLDGPGSTGREALAAFVRRERLNWIHTYSGKKWEDPTVKKYGIRGIPAIWVVGKNGRVVSTNARGNLEAIIEKALKAPAPKHPAPAKTTAGPE